jgi:hypothetical protein
VGTGLHVARPEFTFTARQESEFFAPSVRLSCLLTNTRGEPSRSTSWEVSRPGFALMSTDTACAVDFKVAVAVG